MSLDFSTYIRDVHVFSYLALGGLFTVTQYTFRSLLGFELPYFSIKCML